MDDDFDMAAAVNEISSGLGFDPEEPKEEPASTAEGAAPAAEPAPAEGAPAEGTAPAAESAPAAPAQQPGAPAPVDVNQPPKTWKKEAIAGWELLPAHVKAEVHRREEDMHRGISQYREAANYGQSFRQVLQPYDQLMQHFNVTPQQVIPGLMQAHATLVTGDDQTRIGVLDQLVRQYNIPLPKLLAKLTGGTYEDPSAPFEDPAVRALREELGQVKSTLTARERAEQQATQGRLRSEVDAFAADPANIHFADVADDMALLLRANSGLGLKAAYDKAVWTNPVARQKELDRIQTAAEATRAKAEAERVAAAKKAASANLRSSNRPSSGTAAGKTKSIDDTLAEAHAAIMARH